MGGRSLSARCRTLGTRLRVSRAAGNVPLPSFDRAASHAGPSQPTAAGTGRRRSAGWCALLGDASNRHFERRIKRAKNTARFCPLCSRMARDKGDARRALPSSSKPRAQEQVPRREDAARNLRVWRYRAASFDVALPKIRASAQSRAATGPRRPHGFSEGATVISFGEVVGRVFRDECAGTEFCAFIKGVFLWLFALKMS